MLANLNAMEFRSCLLIFTLICVVLVLSDASASVPAVEYWKSVLPNTPIPKPLQQLLGTGDKLQSPHEFGDIFSGELLASDGNRYLGKYSADKSGTSERFASSDITLFFLYKDFHPGKRVNLIFSKSSDKARFLPRQVANSIPFSSDKLPDILKYFSIKTSSNKANLIRETIENCEAATINGEEKFCPTSLESLVDFGVSKLGRNVMIVSNEVEKENKKQEYNILKGIKMIGDKQVVCHKEIYPYAVFYCHKLTATKAYTVPLMGSDGSKAKGLVICHSDTSQWNPKHIAFKLLHVKPGGPPICHFLNSDSTVWVPN